MWMRMSSWVRKRGRRTRILLVALPLLLLLGLAYYSARELALRSADHVTVTITGSDADGVTNRINYRQTFGPSVAARAQQLLNDSTVLHRIDTKPGGILPVNGPFWHYHLAFTWHGLLVETADMEYDRVPEQYTVSALGLTDLGMRLAVDSSGDSYSLVAQLSQASGGAILIPPAEAIHG